MRESIVKNLKTRRYTSFFLISLLFLASCTTLKRCAYEGVGRDSWQQPQKVIQSLDIQPGARVADLGSGGGYFTFRLARAVGPTGKVYAVDVDEGMNRDLLQRAQIDGFENIETILARPEDPLLPDSGVDWIFTVNTYHHIHERVRYFAHVKKYLREGARIAIIDFNEEGWIQSLGHYTPAAVIKKEMAEAGYRLQLEFDFLPKQNFLIFNKTSPSTPLLSKSHRGPAVKRTVSVASRTLIANTGGPCKQRFLPRLAKTSNFRTYRRPRWHANTYSRNLIRLPSPVPSLITQKN